MTTADLISVLVGFLPPATAVRLSHTCRKYRCLVTEHDCWAVTKHNIGLTGRSTRRVTPFQAVIKYACSCCRAARRIHQSPICAACRRTYFPALEKCMREKDSTLQIMVSRYGDTGLSERWKRLEDTRLRLLSNPQEACRPPAPGRDLVFFQTCPPRLLQAVKTPQVRVRIVHIP